jgi:hypothetical protein
LRRQERFQVLPQHEGRKSLTVPVVYLALGVVILILWLFWEGLVWWIPW